ncbi:MAG: hypothetical protein EBR71_09370 [Planctomycetes bacterium]|nr:hypothetical protein [Planctomycetota bacterium]
MALLLAGLACLGATHPAMAQAGAGGNAAEAWRKSDPLLRPKSDTNPDGLLTEAEFTQLNELFGRSNLSPEEVNLARLRLAQLQCWRKPPRSDAATSNWIARRALNWNCPNSAPCVTPLACWRCRAICSEGMET